MTFAISQLGPHLELAAGFLSKALSAKQLDSALVGSCIPTLCDLAGERVVVGL